MVGKKEIYNVLEVSEIDIQWIFKNFTKIWDGSPEHLKLIDKIRDQIFCIENRLSLLKGQLEHDITKRNNNRKISREVNRAYNKVGNLFLAFLDIEKVKYYNLKRNLNNNLRKN